MIAGVTGRVAALGPTGAVIEVGGVGLEVHCTPGTLAGLRTGDTATLATALIVREDALTLYGFADVDEREVFELLQTASGVGPKLAQAVLAVHRPDAVRRAVATEDIAALTLVPGVGKKGAQRLVLELKDRLGAPTEPVVPAGGGPSSGPAWRPQLHAALTGLGYSAREADDALLALAPEAGEDADVGALLRAALQLLGRTR